MKKCFDTFDVDGSGFIDRAELSKLLGDMGGSYSDAEIALIFEHVDSDNSGQINFLEFLKWWAARPGSDDAVATWTSGASRRSTRRSTALASRASASKGKRRAARSGSGSRERRMLKQLTFKMDFHDERRTSRSCATRTAAPRRSSASRARASGRRARSRSGRRAVPSAS